MPHKGPCQGHALLLADGKFVRFRPGLVTQLDHVQRLLQFPRRIEFPAITESQAIADVLLDCHVREQREVLEHHVELAGVGREIGDVLTVQENAAAIRVLETADHAQGRRLAATRRPQHRHVLAVFDAQAEIVDCGQIAEGLRDLLQFDNVHAWLPGSRIRPGQETFPSPARGGIPETADYSAAFTAFQTSIIFAGRAGSRHSTRPSMYSG